MSAPRQRVIGRPAAAPEPQYAEAPSGQYGPGRHAGPVLYAPPPPGYAEHSQGVPEAHDPVAISARNQVVDRMVLLSANHAQLAWQNPAPICPHAVAFLYADTVETPQAGATMATWHRIVAASRIVHDTPDVRDLPSLLFRLARLARTRYLPTTGGFDPAVHMSVYTDTASGNAQYVGIGVSTLDTIDTSWEQACQRAEDVDDLGGRAFALLFDHTAILIDRGSARRTRADLGIHATRELNYQGDVAPRLWTRHPDVSSMPVAREVWDLMHDLHQLIYHQNPRPTL